MADTTANPLASLRLDRLNVIPPDQRPMVDVLWEKVDRLRAVVAALADALEDHECTYDRGDGACPACAALAAARREP